MNVYSAKFTHNESRETSEIFVVASSPEAALRIANDKVRGYRHDWSLASLFCLMEISAVEES